MTSVILRIPQMAVSMQNGTLLEWHADDGADVSEGQALYALEIEKTVVDVESPTSGILKHIGKQGESYEVGAIIGKITAA